MRSPTSMTAYFYRNPCSRHCIHLNVLEETNITSFGWEPQRLAQVHAVLSALFSFCILFLSIHHGTGAPNSYSAGVCAAALPSGLRVLPVSPRCATAAYLRDTNNLFMPQAPFPIRMCPDTAGPLSRIGCAFVLFPEAILLS
jgi:hypothetical protein